MLGHHRGRWDHLDPDYRCQGLDRLDRGSRVGEDYSLEGTVCCRKDLDTYARIRSGTGVWVPRCYALMADDHAMETSYRDTPVV